MNAFELRARHIKAQRIVDAVDAELRAISLDPFAPEVLRRLGAHLSGMTPALWAELCRRHDVHAPSPATTAMVEAQYEHRLAQLEARQHPYERLERWIGAAR